MFEGHEGASSTVSETCRADPSRAPVLAACTALQAGATLEQSHYAAYNAYYDIFHTHILAERARSGMYTRYLPYHGLPYLICPK